MEIKIKGFILSDTGVKEFTTEKNQIIKYRQIGVVGEKDLEPISISVPLDMNIKLHSEIDRIGEIKKVNNKLKLSLM
ncbi:MAG: hypothetical protein KAI57_02840 [Candidatus Pacebacteria bacterium]|nr:hypothetical protein [Candidatus Paceibacterota bacterium]